MNWGSLPLYDPLRLICPCIISITVIDYRNYRNQPCWYHSLWSIIASYQLWYQSSVSIMVIDHCGIDYFDWLMWYQLLWPIIDVLIIVILVLSNIVIDHLAIDYRDWLSCIVFSIIVLVKGPGKYSSDWYGILWKGKKRIKREREKDSALIHCRLIKLGDFYLE